MADIEKQIDALYQLPPADFTAARAELVRTLTGALATRVKQLRKPPVVPWSVNQLYWRARPIYERLRQRGQALRAAHVAALRGKPADVRQAAETHRRAIGEAVHRAVELAADAGLTPDPEPLARMLEALSLAPAPPAAPGRFTEVLQPAAFEALAGITPATRAKATVTPTAERPPKPSPADRVAEKKREQIARVEQQLAERALKIATRALARARKADVRAHQALDRAQADVRAAEAAVTAAGGSFLVSTK